MNAKDLMIGDWVRTEAGELIIAGIGQKIYCRDDSGNPTHIWEVTTIEPIPLTPEILLKNGFEEWKQPRLTTLWTGYGKDNEDDLEVTFVESNGSTSVKLDVKGSLLMTMNVNHVHELQHAFRLCGIEKEIKL